MKNKILDVKKNMDSKKRISLVVVVNTIMVIALILCLVLYNTQTDSDTKTQNVNNISNISLSKAKLSKNILNNSTAAIKSIYNYCNNKSVDDTLDFMSNIFCNETEEEYQLLKCTDVAFSDTIFSGYSTEKTIGLDYFNVIYHSTNQPELIKLFEQKLFNKGEVFFTNSFTNQTDGSWCYAPFCAITLTEGSEPFDYIILNPKKNSVLIQGIKMATQYSELSTAIFDKNGQYLANDASFKSVNFFDYLYEFNGFNIEAKNILREQVINDENETGVLYKKNSKKQDCTFVYSHFSEISDWYVVVSVLNSDYVSKSFSDIYPPLLLLLVLLILMIYDATVLLRTIGQLKISVINEKKANLAKTDFLSRMSHDIRTPMNGIVGLTDLTLDIEGLPKEAENNLRFISSSNKYLINLINDILDINMISSGKVELYEEIEDVENLISNVVQLSHASIVDKSLSFVLEKDLDYKEIVMLDKIRVKQIFMNILSNAIKFTERGGRITFSCQCKKKENNRLFYTFIIKDTGVGMTQNFINKIFEPFSREYNSLTSKFAGSGLGMSIVKTFIDLMKGSIVINSEKGKGTEVIINLDFKIADNILVEQNKSLKDYSALEGKRVLIVDDHPINITIAQKMLEKCGVIVESAENGEQAVRIIKESKKKRFNAILMDVKMPVMDGIEATKQIRRMSRVDAQTIPIIAMTANAFADDIKATKNAGMNAHLSKPIDRETLYEELIKQIKRELKNE